MTTEPLYKPKGAGHSAPEGDRRGYVKPRDGLVEMFRGWLGNPDSQLKMPFDSLGEVTSREINALLPMFSGHPNIKQAGRFLTELYRGSTLREFVFESDIDGGTDYLGKGLPHWHTLIIRSGLGNYAGEESHGVIVNLADTEDWDCFGEKSDGININCGNVRTMGRKANGLTINLGNVTFMVKPYPSGVFIDYGVSDDKPNGEEMRVIYRKRRDMDFVRMEWPAVREIPGFVKYMRELKAGLDPSRTDEEIFSEIRKRDRLEEIRKRGMVMDIRDMLGLEGLPLEP